MRMGSGEVCDALREVIINGVAHRDYFEKGANVMVTKGLRPEDFGRKSVLRDPNIANLLHRAGYIEKMGTGINKMRRLMADAGLSPIEFEFGTFFTAIFRRLEKRKKEEGGGVFGGVFGGVNEDVAGRLGKLVMALSGKQMNTSQLAVIIDTSKRTLGRDIAYLKDKGFVEFMGAPKTGGYVLTEKGKKIMGEMGG
jgi:ATP-dependent DNA helicase RecG